MEIQIPQEAESTVRDLAVRAGFASVEQYVLNLIHRDSETAAIKVGLQEARAGKFRSFQSFDAEFRASVHSHWLSLLLLYSAFQKGNR